MPIQSFKDIIAWQKAHELTLIVYGLTAKFPKHELFGLVSQMQRSAVSVPSNKRKVIKEKVNKIQYAFMLSQKVLWKS